MQPTVDLEEPEPAASSLRPTVPFARVRGYDLTTRLVGSGWFLLLAAITARTTFSQANALGATAFSFSHTGWPWLLSRVCLVTFYLMVWWLIITRSPPSAQSGGVMPTLTAFVGTYLPWSISAVGTSVDSGPLHLLSATCLVCGTLLMVYTLRYLGRSFSIVPQARRIVQAGPYRWIRHPLYLSEETAILGVVIEFLSPATVGVLLAHIAIQIRRILYEENLLHRSLPEYITYAASKWRLVPYLW
jgi:protein-S-isoprenylcysteine O-methyltransferase Ste14